jgi:hypothetical protein
MEQPPQINPYEYMLGRINWRYRKGVPIVGENSILLGDSTREINKVSNLLEENK